MSGYWLAGGPPARWPTILQTTARLHPDNLSERLPLRGSGDELDQLSATMNSMLDRLAAHLEQQRFSSPTRPMNCVRRWPPCAPLWKCP